MAPLRRLKGYRLVCRAQQAAAARSREIGFATHLSAPLNPVEIAHQIAVAAPADLATRWQRSWVSLARYLTRIAPLSEMTREVASPLEPGSVAEALVSRVAAWLPAPTWTVVGLDAAGAPAVLATWRLPLELEKAVCSVGARVMRSGQEYGARDLRDDVSGLDVPGIAVVAFPLRCRGRSVGAVIGVDTTPSAKVPVVPASVTAAIRVLFEPAAVALDNALRMQRAKALTITDDLTQLYNSRYLSEVLRREGKRATRTHQPLSLLFIDLDGFKGSTTPTGISTAAGRSSRRAPSSCTVRVRPTWSPASVATSS